MIKNDKDEWFRIKNDPKSNHFSLMNEQEENKKEKKKLGFMVTGG
jgi:hypothetical protein